MMSRVECQPPMLDAPIDGCPARRRKMISVNSALRSSAPGNITAATGVANNPFTSTSVPDMRGALQTILERDDFSSNRHLALSFCLSMISGQTLRVCPEGKPVPTFPDHALMQKKKGWE